MCELNNSGKVPLPHHHKISILQTADRPYLQWLVRGIKTAEGRVNTPTYQSMRPGDRLTLVDKANRESLTGVITFLHNYASFRKMLENEGVRNMLPFLRDDEVEAGIKIYQSFPGSHRVQIFGCVAIGVRCL